MTGPWIAAFIALWMLLCVLAVIVLGLLRQANNTLAPAVRLQPDPSSDQSLQPGDQLPEFNATDALGVSVGTSHLQGTPAIVLFMKAGCDPCEHLASELADPLRSALDVPVFAVLPEEDREKRLWLGSDVMVLYERDASVSAAFRNSITPQAFAIRSDGVVAARTIPGSVSTLESAAKLASGHSEPLKTPHSTTGFIDAAVFEEVGPDGRRSGT